MEGGVLLTGRLHKRVSLISALGEGNNWRRYRRSIVKFWVPGKKKDGGIAPLKYQTLDEVGLKTLYLPVAPCLAQKKGSHRISLP